jgi:hypothetical protein
MMFQEVQSHSAVHRKRGHAGPEIDHPGPMIDEESSTGDSVVQMNGSGRGVEMRR